MNTVALGLIIPFTGTTLGAAMVFLLKDEISPNLRKLLLGFASGVMIAAIMWSLLIPSIDMAESQGIAYSWLPAATGFAIGICFLLLLDSIIPHLHSSSDEPEGVQSNFKKSTMIILAITLHNIPEGMAVGVVLAGMMEGASNITVASALALAIGIAIQNIPEGAIVSAPLRLAGNSRMKAFVGGTLSGIIEPIAAIITILLIQITLPALPYILAFAAGSMMYVVVEELLPDLQSGKHSNIGIIGLALGFIMMMIMDSVLG